MPDSVSPWPGIRSGHQNHSVPTLQYLLRARGHSVTTASPLTGRSAPIPKRP